jgi:hypothetical protein
MARSLKSRTSPTATWGLLAGAAGASTWFVIGLPSIVLGAFGLTLGIGSARAASPRSRDWWLGIVAVALGAVPLVWFAFYYVAIAMDWGHYGD